METSFSFKRFWSYAKAQLRTDKKIPIIFYVLLGSYLFLMFLSILTLTFKIELVDSMVLILSGVYLSMSFSQFFMRGKAEFAMMLPASRAEKFTYSALMGFVVMPLALLAVSLVIVHGYNWGWRTCMPELFLGNRSNVDVGLSNQLTDNFLINLSAVFFFFSIYFLGAALFRKVSFVWVSLIILTVSIFGGLVVIGNLPENGNFYCDPTKKAMFGWGLFAFGVLFLVLSWVRYKRIQVK